MGRLLIEKWRTCFFKTVEDSANAEQLKNAALQENLSDWTRALTKAVVETSKALGLRASAKDNKLDLLPINRSEYLTMDVMVFPEGLRRWHFPIAVMELENKNRNEQIAYSLWKVLCIRADLRLVFCYRRDKQEISSLLKHLRENVMEIMGITGRQQLDGEIGVVIGCRDKANTFPYGFFKWWRFDKDIGKFEQLL